MHKVLTLYGMRKTDRLNKAQVRKVAKLILNEKGNLGRAPGAFVRAMIEEYPALKKPEQQLRVMEKVEPGFTHSLFASKLLEKVG